MSIIAKGLNEVLETVETKAEKYPEVVAADSHLKAIMNSFTLSHEEFMQILDAAHALGAASIHAGFRLGVTEGLKLANEVRALLEPERSGNDGE